MTQPKRATVNYDLFCVLLSRFQTTYRDSTPDAISIEEIKERILNSALQVAVNRAYKKFGWPDGFECWVEINPYGSVSNMHGKNHGVSDKQAAYLENEVRKISAGALQALF